MQPRSGFMRNVVVAMAFVLGSGLVVAGIAVATPGSGASGTVLASGVSTEKVKTRGNQPFGVAVQRITIAPGGHTGWHTHPGQAIAVVMSGTLTIYNADDPSCSPNAYTAGQVYVDPGYGFVHIGRNEGATPLEIAVTYLDIELGGAFRLDEANPGNCGF